MPLGDDAGEVGEDGVGEDDEVGGEGVPNDKKGNHNHLQPMRKLTATGLELKLFQVVRVARLKRALGEP